MTAQSSEIEKRRSRRDGESPPAAESDPRAALFAKLTQLAIGADAGGETERLAEIDASLSSLVHAVAPAARERVAKSIAPAKLPLPKLIGSLARDEIAVARPILRSSPVLSDEVLVDVIHEGGQSHRLEIAARSGLTAGVTEALIENGELDVLQAVAANEGAIFHPKDLDKMARASEDSAALSATLLQRTDLPALSAHRMFWWVAGPFREKILKSHVVDVRDVRRLLSESVSAGLVESLETSAVDRLLANMMRNTRPPTNDLVSILRRGSLASFVEALQTYLGVNEETARRIVEDNGGEAVAVACRALDADRGQFTSIFLQLDYLRFGKARPVARLAQISNVYDRVSHGRAAASVVMWTVLTQGTGS